MVFFSGQAKNETTNRTIFLPEILKNQDQLVFNHPLNNPRPTLEQNISLINKQEEDKSYLCKILYSTCVPNVIILHGNDDGCYLPYPHQLHILIQFIDVMLFQTVNIINIFIKQQSKIPCQMVHEKLVLSRVCTTRPNKEDFGSLFLYVLVKNLFETLLTNFGFYL